MIARIDGHSEEIKGTVCMLSQPINGCYASVRKRFATTALKGLQ